MMKVLAVDLAATTGVAFGRPLTAPESWTVDFIKWRDEARLARVIRWVLHIQASLTPDLIAVEAPIGGKDANAMLIGMVACLRGQAHALGIRSVFYHAASVRHHFIGKSLTSRHFPDLKQAEAKLAIKNVVKQRCISLGWEPKTLDEADACALWDYACARESMEHQVANVGGLFGGEQ